MNDEYLACCTKKRCFALTIPCAFAKTFEEEKKPYFVWSQLSARNGHF